MSQMVLQAFVCLRRDIRKTRHQWLHALMDKEKAPGGPPFGRPAVVVDYSEVDRNCTEVRTEFFNEVAGKVPHRHQQQFLMPED